MKVLIFFALFSITEYVTCSKQSYLKRVYSAYKVNDVLGTVEKSRRFEEFWKTMDATYEIYDYFRIKVGTVKTNTVHVNKKLELLNHMFMYESYMYIKQLIWEYCELALRIIKENTDNSDSDIRRRIGFPDEQEYCMLTAFHDLKFRVDLTFQSTFLLQTINADDKYTWTDLENGLEEYRQRFSSDLKHTGYMKLLPDVESVDLLSRIRDIKHEIAAFSNIFCSHWRPFVSHNMVKTKTALYDDLKDSFFMRYVFHNEKCVINFHPFDYWPNSNWRVKENFIDSWYCDKILVFVSKQNSNTDMNEPKTECQNQKEFSLAALKRELKSHTYYLTFVKYSNIVSDVVLLVSIKEGTKILIGIKLVVRRKCNENNENLAVDEIRGLKSPLSLFKSVMEKLVSIILDKERIDMTENPHKRIFDERADSLMKSLDIRGDRARVRRICSEIPDVPEDIDYDSHLGDDPTKMQFEKFYFTDPILNVTQLYHFVESNFL